MHMPDDSLSGASAPPQRSAGRAASFAWPREFVELLVLQFIFGLGYSMFYLLPKYLRLELHATASQIGLVTGTGLVAAVAATPIAALWLSRGKRRGPAQLSLIVLVLAALAFTQVTRMGWFLLGLRALQGLAFTIFQSAVVTRGAELAPRERLGQAMGYVGLAALVTNALSPLIAEPLAERFGWSAVFVLAAGYGLLGMAFTVRLRDATVPETAASTQSSWSPHMLTILYAGAVCGVALGVMFTYTQPLALERGARTVGSLFTGYVVAAAAVRLLLGSLADRVGRGRVSIAALLAYALVTAATPTLIPSGLLWAGIGLGTAHGILYPALNAMAIERATPQHRSLIATTFGGAFNLGHALSVLCFGIAADTLGYPVVFFSGAGLALTGALALTLCQGGALLSCER